MSAACNLPGVSRRRLCAQVLLVPGAAAAGNHALAEVSVNGGTSADSDGGNPAVLALASESSFLTF